MTADWTRGWIKAVEEIRTALRLRSLGEPHGGDKLVMGYVDTIVQLESPLREVVEPVPVDAPTVRVRDRKKKVGADMAGKGIAL